MNEREMDMALRMFSTGFADVVVDTFARYGETGIWVGEWTMANTRLARVITDREPDYQDRDAAMGVTKVVVGARELSEEREARIASAAQTSIDKYRRSAVAFPGQYIFRQDVTHDADDLAGGSTGSMVDGTMIRRLPFSRVERVVLETLGFTSPVITDAGEVIKQGVDALNRGRAAQDEFATRMSNHGWLFRNADPADYTTAPQVSRSRGSFLRRRRSGN